ncbi:MAG: hypothetical protein ACR2RL_16970 [Gammaproteobacteria bacterium]
MNKPWSKLAGVSLFALSAGLPVPGVAADLAEATAWHARVNRPVHKAHHWTWTLRTIERREDRLVLALAFRNNGNNKRPILLDADFMNSVVLVDDAAQQAYKLVSVEGISAEMSQVARKRTGESVFVFEYPHQSTKVRFSSRWLTMFMANGAASIIDVAFDVSIPPPGAKPG